MVPAATFAKDLGADELSMVELVMAYERVFPIDIPNARCRSFQKVPGRDRLSAESAPPTPLRPSSDSRSPFHELNAAVAGRPSMVSLRSFGRDSP